MSDKLLTVEGLDVLYHTRGVSLKALSDIEIEVDRGEILGVVGESGCGKSTLAAALLRLLPSNGEIAAGRIELNGRDVLTLHESELEEMRGREVAMIFQDPLTSLNPTFTIGKQLIAAQRAHESIGSDSISTLRQRAIDMLTRVGIPDAPERIRYFPHQFSGGMRQRIMIAMALLLEPDLLIADEATSSLDVTLQAQILELLRQLRRDRDTAMILVSHDIGVISEICDRVVVMYAGRAVEQGKVRSVLEAPKHPYTRALLGSVPTKERRDERLASIPGQVPSLSHLPPGCKYHPRCPSAQPVCRASEPRYLQSGQRDVRCYIYDSESDYDSDSTTVEVVSSRPRPRMRENGREEDALVELRGVKTYFYDRVGPIARALGQTSPPVRAVDGVDLEIQRGEIVGLVGESGSGKTTLGRSILNLVPISSGNVHYEGQDLGSMDREQMRRFRRSAQIIFQDAHASLSPRLRVSRLLTEPYVINGIPPDERTSVSDLLDMVQLSSELADKYPNELSGGQARRVGIARALALRPDFIVADEPSAGLDVSAAASVLNLMRDLAAELGLTYLIITHDLNMVGYIADRIALMYLGKLVEVGPTDRIFSAPSHPYTQALLNAVPMPSPKERSARHRLLLPGEIPSPKHPPPGCRFHTRCRYAQEECQVDQPELERVEEGHAVACYFWREVALDVSQKQERSIPLGQRDS